MKIYISQDTRHIVARGKCWKNGAETLDFKSEEEATIFLDKWLKQFKKEGYKIEQIDRYDFILTK